MFNHTKPYFDLTNRIIFVPHTAHSPLIALRWLLVVVGLAFFMVRFSRHFTQ